MFNTGRRSIFEVTVQHIGHSIEILPIDEEGITVGVRYYCRTCNETLLQQETQDWQIREAVEIRKASRLNAMSYEQWEELHHQDMERGHADDCGCDGGYWECQEGCGPYEGTELSQFYNEYLESVERPQQRSAGGMSARCWDVNESDCWET